MCLVIKQDTKFEVAQEDIVVYKRMILSKKMLFGIISQWMTPYQLINVGCIKKGKELKAKGCVTRKPINMDFDIIEGGVIHLFEDKDDSIDSCFFMPDNSKAFECIIPKGTEYIVGRISNTTRVGVGAKKIVFVKKIN